MIALHPIEKDAATELLQKLRNSQELVEPLGTSFRYMTQTQIEELVLKWCKGSKDEERCVIYEEDNPLLELLGFISLTSIDFFNQSAEFSIQLLPNMTGKGFGTEATKAMLLHGFRDLNLNRIYLYVLTDNEPAISCYIKCGFKTEGRLKKSVFKDGKHKDQFIMSILKEDFSFDF